MKKEGRGNKEATFSPKGLRHLLLTSCWVRQQQPDADRIRETKQTSVRNDART